MSDKLMRDSSGATASRSRQELLDELWKVHDPKKPINPYRPLSATEEEYIATFSSEEAQEEARFWIRFRISGATG